MISNNLDFLNTLKKKFSSGQNEVRPIFFSGSLAVCHSASVADRGGRKGGLGGIPPVESVFGKIGSDFFVNTPPIGKCFCWLALCEGSPALLPFKSECFVFVPQWRDGQKKTFSEPV